MYELELEEEVYCGVCRHFGCPVANDVEAPKSEHLSDEPCGRFDCCIN